MNYPRIFERVYMQPLCVHPARFASIHAFLLPRLTGKTPFEVNILQAEEARKPAQPNKSAWNAKRRQTARPVVDDWTGEIIDPRMFSEPKTGVAVVPVYGALAKNLSSFEESCGGGTDINAIQEALKQAVEDEGIHAIILDQDSPGGEVTGIPEFGAQVRAAAAVKPVYAFSDAMSASASYWLSSQATEIYGTPSSSWGSIGTYLAWLDESVKMQMEGVALKLYAEGKHKGMGLPGRPMSADDDALLRNRVKTINDQFKATVASTRPGVDDDTMQGQTFSGSEALDRGLIDGLVGSFDELLALI